MDIRIDRAGSGPPVVVLNGLLGLNEHWFPCVGRLIDRAEVILLQPPLLEMKGSACSVDGVTRLLGGVIETFVEQPAVIVGNSLGGHVALRLALERHPLVGALVLVGSSGLFERGFERGVEHSPSRGWLERKIEGLFFDPSRMLPGMVDVAYAELSRRPAARALVRLGRSAKNDHLGERLAGLPTPTLLAWGRNDAVTPPEVAEQFRALLPDSRLVWLERCGHAPQIEQPEALASAIGGFLDELSARRVVGAAGAA
jgi:pimeloyl-ACP methyl ester carboxylesterase